MTIWITGARGFIGRHLARYLAAGGARVTGIGHGAWPDHREWGVERWLNGVPDAANLGQLARDGERPEQVFHLAGGASVGAAFAAPHEDFTRTVVTTAGLLDWLRREAPAARLVAVSSAAVYGSRHAGPIFEDAVPEPYSPYGAHKLMMEQLCRSYATNFKLKVVLPRLFSVYGGGLRKQLLWDLCEKLRSGAPVELGGSGRELRDWTEIGDVVRALAQVAELASTDAPAINAGSGRGVDVAAIAALVVLATGEHQSVAFSGQSRAGDPASLVAAPGALAAHGFEWRVAVETGIGDYVRWHRWQAGHAA